MAIHRSAFRKAFPGDLCSARNESSKRLIFFCFLFRTPRRYPSFFLCAISDEYTRTEATIDVDNFSIPTEPKKKAHKHCHTVTKWPLKGLRFPQLLHLRVIRMINWRSLSQVVECLALNGPSIPQQDRPFTSRRTKLHTKSRLLCSHRLMLDRCYYWLRQLDIDICSRYTTHYTETSREEVVDYTQCCW